MPLDVAISRIQARYLSQLPTCMTDWPNHKVSEYVKLTFVVREDTTLSDFSINKSTKQLMQDEMIDGPFSDLKNIFHYQGLPCPRVILLVGGPGEPSISLCRDQSSYCITTELFD